MLAVATPVAMLACALGAVHRLRQAGTTAGAAPARAGADGRVLGASRGAEVELRFTLPTANANGPGPIDLDRVEVYAVTVAAGALPPPNRDVLTTARSWARSR